MPLKKQRHATNLNGKNNQGFTLIELLVVIIILSVLVAASLPAFVRQIGKSRESDAKINLGAIARGQQAYHFEKGTFADSNSNLSLTGSFTSVYYDFVNPSIANDNVVRHEAVPYSAFQDGVRNYAVGVYFNSGLYSNILCQGAEIGEIVQAPTTADGICTNAGIQLK